MLFVVDHEHTAENCPGRPVRPVKNFDKNLTNAAKSSGIELHRLYVDIPGYHIYAIAEAETFDQLTRFVAPALTDAGTTHIHPVVKW